MNSRVGSEKLISVCSSEPQIAGVNPLRPRDAIWQHISGSYFDSDNGLLLDATEPLPDPILTSL